MYGLLESCEDYVQMNALAHGIGRFRRSSRAVEGGFCAIEAYAFPRGQQSTGFYKYHHGLSLPRSNPRPVPPPARPERS